MADQTISSFDDLLTSTMGLPEDFIDAIYVHAKSWAIATTVACATMDFNRRARNAALVQILIGISTLIEDDISSDEMQVSFAMLGEDGEVAASIFVDAERLLSELERIEDE